MEYGICSVGISPIRAQASDKSEITSELLFGELVLIHENKGSWAYVQSDSDGYVGWCDPKQIQLLSLEEFNLLSNCENGYIFEDSVLAKSPNGDKLVLVKGSSIPLFFSEDEELVRSILGKVIDIDYLRFFKRSRSNNIIETANEYINSSYRWGGKTPFGVDCSGFTQMVYRLGGVFLPRDASEQAKEGVTINLLTEAIPGDLVFFDNSEGDIIHTGIFLGNDKIIHASGKVRIDMLDHYGIFNQEQQNYSHKLRIIKRY